jgi:hypothetical protein
MDRDQADAAEQAARRSAASHDAAVQIIDTPVMRVHKHGAYMADNNHQARSLTRGPNEQDSGGCLVRTSPSCRTGIMFSRDPGERLRALSNSLGRRLFPQAGQRRVGVHRLGAASRTTHQDTYTREGPDEKTHAEVLTGPSRRTRHDVFRRCMTVGMHHHCEENRTRKVPF